MVGPLRRGLGEGVRARPLRKKNISLLFPIDNNNPHKLFIGTNFKENLKNRTAKILKYKKTTLKIKTVKLKDVTKTVKMLFKKKFSTYSYY